MKEKMANFKAIDIFSGVGGFSLGVRAAGFDISWAIDKSQIHLSSYKMNCPAHTMRVDITSLSEKDREIIKIANPDIDLLSGGPPCQGFSIGGHQNEDDPRNNLVFEYVKFLKLLAPKYFIFENVPGLLSAKFDNVRDLLLDDFQSLGYNLDSKLMFAADWGIPQSRKRWIVLGSRLDVPQVFIPSNAPLRRNSVEFALSDLSDIEPYIGDDIGIDPAELSQNKYSLWLDDEFKLCEPASKYKAHRIYGHIASKHSLEVIERFKKAAPGCKERVSRFYKLQPDSLSPTLRAGSELDKGGHTAPRPIHYKHLRCITIREAARLHSYPDWFQFDRRIYYGMMQIGNSVPPILAKAIAMPIMEALRSQ